MSEANQPKKTQEAATIRPEFSLRDVAQNWLHEKVRDIENIAQSDALTIFGGIMPGVDIKVRMALEGMQNPRASLLVILHTGGGVVEEVQNIVKVLRHHYEQVYFLIPVYAMSAGTVMAMSGDKIYMDYFSRLGPIDPQVPDDSGKKYVPALSYLHQYEKLIDKSRDGTITTAEFALLQNMDLANLHRIELAAKLAMSLIENWLPRYMFKNLTLDGKVATDGDKSKKAESIALTLNDHKKWFSHSYSIHKDVLENDLGIKVDDYGEVQNGRLKKAVWQYFLSLWEHVGESPSSAFVHSREFI